MVRFLDGKNQDSIELTEENDSEDLEKSLPIPVRTDRFEQFHTETSKILMKKLYPADFSEDAPPAHRNKPTRRHKLTLSDIPTRQQEDTSTDMPEPSDLSPAEEARPRIDITGTLPKRTSNNPDNKAGERLRQSYLAFLRRNPEKIPFAVERQPPFYRPYVAPQRGSAKMHEFFRQEQRLDDEELQKWEDEIRERARFINAENEYFKRLKISEQKRILGNDTITFKPPLSEKEIRNAAFTAVVKQRLKRRKIHIPENEFFIYFNALKTAEKARKPSIYTFENADGFRIVYPENYFPEPDERLDLSLLTPAQKAKAEEQFRKYKITTGVISRPRHPEAFHY